MTNRKMGTLCENSESYFEKSDIYEKFSGAEDYPKKVLKKLIPLVKNKSILDLGCGSGKYIKLLSPYAKSITGVDISSWQLKLTKKNTRKLKNVRLVLANADNLQSIREKFDIMLGCWFLSTISDKKRREKVLTEVRRVLVPNGIIYLVENDTGGQFEEIRGRLADPLKRTQNYNFWLANKMKFNIMSRIKTHFKFKDKTEACSIIREIWGKEAEKKVISRVIGHNVVLFKKKEF